MKKEPWLLKPYRTKEILQKYGIRMQKKFGQNFLIDAHVPVKIIAAAEISEQDLVIEIGPGIGTLTQYLCYAAGSVTAIEIDRHLLPVLTETLADWDNVEVINGDVMKLDLREIIAERLSGSGLTGVRVAANLPYYITTPILMKLLEDELPIQSVTVMVQKEVADRMQAAPGTPDYGALSLAVQYYTRPRLAAIVPPNCFIPRPNVDSAVITLTRLEPEERAQTEHPDHMFKVIKAAFAQRRKTLVNALRNAAELRNADGTSYTREEVEQVLAVCGLDVNVRGEKLSLPEFAKISDLLLKSAE